MLLLPLPWIHSRWKGFYAESLHCFLRIQVHPRWSSYWEAMLLISLWCATVVRGWTTMSLRQWCRVGAGIFRRQSFLRFHWWWQIRFPILRNCSLLFVRAVQGVPTKSVHTSYWGLSREFSYLIEFHLCKDNWFCFSYKQKGLYLHVGNRK